MYILTIVGLLIIFKHLLHIQQQGVILLVLTDQLFTLFLNISGEFKNIIIINITITMTILLAMKAIQIYFPSKIFKG